MKHEPTPAEIEIEKQLREKGYRPAGDNESRATSSSSSSVKPGSKFAAFFCR